VEPWVVAISIRVMLWFPPRKTMSALSLDLFDGVVSFVATSEARSFGVAAKRLGVTTSAVSKAISRLETDLGVRLLHRTSRSVTLTVEGEAFLLRCRVAVGEVHAARATLHDTQCAPRGLLRISLPHRLSRIVTSNLPSLLEAHPLLVVEANVTDRFVHLTEENIDVALRVGELVNSTCVAHRLRVLRLLTVASPAYLKKNKAPRTPEDLSQHNCLSFLLQTGIPQPWSFLRDGAPLTMTVRGNLHADHGESMVSAALSGLGLIQAPDIMITDELAAQTLVEVLPEFVAAGPPLTAICVPGRENSPKVRAYLNLLVNLFGTRAKHGVPVRDVRPRDTSVVRSLVG